MANITNISQISQIATNPYINGSAAVELETLTNAGAVLERQGFTIIEGGEAVVKPFTIVNGAGESVTASAIAETELVTEGNITQIVTKPLAATETATAGGVVGWVSALQFLGAVAIGAGIGLKSYNDYPEFWTEVSNRLFPEGRVPNPMDAIDAGSFVFRVLNDGTIASYCEEERLKKAINELWEMGFFNPSGTITPDHDYTGTYVLNQTETPNSTSQAFDAIARAGRYIATDGQREVIYNAIGDPEAAAITVKMARVGDVPLFKVSVWYDLDTPVHVINDGTARYVDLASSSAVRYVWQIYGDDSSGGGFPSREQADTLLNGTMDGWTVIYSNCDSTTTFPLDEIIFYPDTQIPIYPDQLPEEFPDWWSGAFEVPFVDPSTGTETVKRYVPLSVPDVNPNNAVENNPDAQNEAQEGKYPVDETDPDKLPDPLRDPEKTPFKPPITTPDGDPTKTPEISDGNTPVVIPPTNSGGNKLYTVYHPSNTTLDNLGGYLWNDSIIQSLVELFKNNPMDAIISLHQVYCTPVDGASKNIILGSLNSGITAPVVSNQYVSINCGSVYIPEIYNDARDYINTDCEIYLPFIGFRSIDVRDIVNCSCNVQYTIDLYTGSCLAQLIIQKDNTKQTLYTYEGNCSVQIPLTGSQRTGIVGLIGTCAATLIGGATGGVGGAVAMGIGSAARAVGSGTFQHNIQRTSGFSGNAGAMAIKKPYIILSRNKSADAANYEHFIGNPTNKTVYLNHCTGYTRVKAVHVENIPGATDKEKDMIKALLEGGVIL